MNVHYDRVNKKEIVEGKIKRDLESELRRLYSINKEVITRERIRQRFECEIESESESRTSGYSSNENQKGNKKRKESEWVGLPLL